MAQTNYLEIFMRLFPTIFMMIMLILVGLIYHNVAKLASDKEGFKSAFGVKKSNERFAMMNQHSNCMRECAADEWKVEGSEYGPVTQCELDCSHLVNYF